MRRVLFLGLLLLAAGCISERTAKAGDNVSVDYIMSLENGSAVIATQEADARALGIFDPGQNYTPVRFTIGKGEFFKGMEEAAVGMGVNETKSVTVPPEKGAGAWDPSLVRVIPRYYATSRYTNLSRMEFAYRFNKSASLGDEVELLNWNATVMNITGDTVTLRHEPVVNKTIFLNPFPQRVAYVNNDAIVMELLPNVGTVYSFTNPNTREYQKATVLSVSKDNVTVDYNHVLAGKTLILNITLREIG